MWDRQNCSVSSSAGPYTGSKRALISGLLPGKHFSFFVEFVVNSSQAKKRKKRKEKLEDGAV